MRITMSLTFVMECRPYDSGIMFVFVFLVTLEDIQVAFIMALNGYIAYLPDFTLNYSTGKPSASQLADEAKQFHFVRSILNVCRYLTEKHHLHSQRLDNYFSRPYTHFTDGGKARNGQESIRNGVYNLEGVCGDDDNIIIHDGIRPLVDETVLSDIIIKCNKYGNGVTSMPYNEQIFVIDDEISTVQYIPRETLRRVATPQAYKFGKLDWAYHEAFEKEIGIYGSSYTNTMMVELGERLYFAAGSDKNIKLTTKDDLEMFKAYLKSDKDNWLK